jgi:predicted ATPase
MILPVTEGMLSNGTRRVLNILIFAAIAGIKNIQLLGIEEIETSIHPAKIESFLTVLLQLAPNCKYIITSHSPSVVQFLPSERLYIGQPRNDGNARFLRLSSEGKRKLSKEARHFGISDGELVFNMLSSDTLLIDRLSSYLEDSNNA